MAWLPIESAPRDGTVIDLWSDHRIANMQWCERQNAWGHSYWTMGHARNPNTRKPFRRTDISLDLKPTHWMPLPEPPQPPPQDGEGK